MNAGPPPVRPYVPGHTGTIGDVVDHRADLATSQPATAGGFAAPAKPDHTLDYAVLVGLPLAFVAALLIGKRRRPPRI